jgi:hypothetical protein
MATIAILLLFHLTVPTTPESYWLDIMSCEALSSTSSSEQEGEEEERSSVICV